MRGAEEVDVEGERFHVGKTRNGSQWREAVKVQTLPKTLECPQV